MVTFFKRSVPNLFTFLNMFSGLLAMIFIFKQEYELAAYLVFLGIFSDFFDGFFARKLNVESEIGVELDSLADMVTSGVVPGVMMFSLLQETVKVTNCCIEYLPYMGFVLTLSAAYRLAKFNVITRFEKGFRGLPTPSMSAFVMSIPFVVRGEFGFNYLEALFSGPMFYIMVIVVLSVLMNASIPFLSLKLKSYKFLDNMVVYSLVFVSIVLLFLLQFAAIPLVILIYILVSIAVWGVAKK